MSDDPRQPTLGVVFVHGIGDQSEGATLSQAAEPILEVIGDYSRSTGRAIRVHDAHLKPGDGRPARLRIELSEESEGDTILLAEARWADSFEQPKLLRLVGWSFGYGRRVLSRVMRGRGGRRIKGRMSDPLYVEFVKERFSHLDVDTDPDAASDVVVSRAVDRFLDLHPGFRPLKQPLTEQVAAQDREFLDWLRGASAARNRFVAMMRLYPNSVLVKVIAFAASGVVAAVHLLILPLIALALLPVVVLLLLLVSLLSLIPGVPSPIGALRHRLERSVGDAFVLTGSGVGRAAMETSVLEALRSLSDCDQVVVVAHSQGSVIVEHLLRDDETRAGVAHTVVYGSAIGLLDPASTEWVLSDSWTSYRTEEDPICPLPLRPRVRRDHQPYTRGIDVDGDEAALFDRSDNVLRGWGRPFRSHTSYWSNREEFVLPLVSVLADHLKNPSEPMKTWTDAMIDKVQPGRERRSCTWAGRIAATLTLALLIFGFGRVALRSIGDLLFEVSARSLNLLPDDLTFDAIDRSIDWLTGPSDVASMLLGAVALASIAQVAARNAVWLVWARGSLARTWRVALVSASTAVASGS